MGLVPEKAKKKLMQKNCVLWYKGTFLGHTIKLPFFPLLNTYLKHLGVVGMVRVGCRREDVVIDI